MVSNLFSTQEHLNQKSTRAVKTKVSKMENLPEVYQNNELVIYQTLIYQGKTTWRQIEAKPRREIALSRKRQELKETNYVSC